MSKPLHTSPAAGHRRIKILQRQTVFKSKPLFSCAGVFLEAGHVAAWRLYSTGRGVLRHKQQLENDVIMKSWVDFENWAWSDASIISASRSAGVLSYWGYCGEVIIDCFHEDTTFVNKQSVFYIKNWIRIKHAWINPSAFQLLHMFLSASMSRKHGLFSNST